MKEAAAKTLPKPSVLSLAQLLTEQPASPPSGWIEPGLLPPQGMARLVDAVVNGLLPSWKKEER